MVDIQPENVYNYMLGVRMRRLSGSCGEYEAELIRSNKSGWFFCLQRLQHL